MHDTDPEAQTLIAREEAKSESAAVATVEFSDTTGVTDPTRMGGGKSKKKAHKKLERGSALGRYVILNHLGAGGMGVVYAAYDPELDRKIAIKLLQAGGDDNDDRDDTAAGQARLVREAQAMARLTHPNVIAVYDVGTFGSAVFVAMEFVSGVTMTAHMSKLWKAGAPPWREVVALYLAAGRGLAAAHAAGIVHRDFKPDNIMVSEQGRVLVLDFGLARPTGDAGPLSSDDGLPGEDGHRLSSSGFNAVSSGPMSAQLTRTGAVMGTPAYMSPEQMTGQQTDGPTDQFSFCVALYRGLYGERPFPGSSLADLTTSVLRGRVREIPRGAKVPQWLRRVLLRGLARSPDDRYASMDALLAAVRRNPAKRRSTWALGVGAVGLATLAALAGLRIGKNAPCINAAQAMSETWNTDRANLIDSAFRAVGKTYALDVYKKLNPAITEYADAWSAQRKDACRATRVRGAQSDEVMGLRMACLDRRRHRLDMFLEILEDADPEIAAAALASMPSLPQLEACADTEALTSEVAPPEDPQTAREVVDLRLEIERAKAIAISSRFSEAESIMRGLLVRANNLSYRPIQAEVAGETADLLENLGLKTEAEALAKRSLLIAEAAGSDRFIVLNLLTLARIQGDTHNDFDKAMAYADRAAAVIDRRGNKILDRIKLSFLRATIARSAKRSDEAIEHLEKAWALRVEAGLTEVPGAIRCLSTLGTEYIKSGDLERGEALAQQTDALSKRLLGPLHPNIGFNLVSRGRLNYAKNDPEAALRYYERARAIFVDSLGPEHMNVAAIDNARGLAYLRLGRTADAQLAYKVALQASIAARGSEHLAVAAVRGNLGDLLRGNGLTKEAVEQHERALAIKIELLGEDHDEIALVRDTLGDDFRRGKDYERAMISYERSIEHWERTMDMDASQLSYPLSGIGMIYLAQGDPARALPVLERAVELDVAADVDAEAAARAGFPLAQALWENGEIQRSLRLAHAAEKGWAVAEGENADALKRVRAWIDDHPAIRTGD